MKQWELRRGPDLVALIHCHQIVTGKSPFLVMIRNEKDELLASIYLGVHVELHEIPADDKSLQS